MPDIIAWLLGMQQDVWGFTPNFKVYKVEVLVNLNLWRIITQQICNIPTQPTLPQFKWISQLYGLPSNMTIHFPWPASIIVKNKFKPTDANKVVGHAEPTLYSDKEPTTLLSNSRSADQAAADFAFETRSHWCCEAASQPTSTSFKDALFACFFRCRFFFEKA